MSNTDTIDRAYEKVDRDEKLIALAKAWTQLESEQQNLDFRRTQWCAKARELFKTAHQFKDWLRSDLNLTVLQSEELEFRSRMAKVVDDLATWKAVGGMRQIRLLEQVPANEQTRILSAAKATGHSVKRLVREKYPHLGESKHEAIKNLQIRDVDVLAKFIAENVDKLPRLPAKVKEIVELYVPGFQLTRTRTVVK